MVEQMFIIKNLDTGEEIDVRDENKQVFPQKLATMTEMQGQRPEIEEFYKQKREVNTNLLECVERNDIDGVKELLDKTTQGALVAQANAKGLNDWTALHLAAADGFQEATAVLLSHGEGTNIDAETSMQRTPLHLACLHGHFAVVVILLKHGADVNHIDIEGNSSLHYASMHGHPTIVSLLLEQFPEISIGNCLSKTALDVALYMDCYAAILAHCQRHGLEAPHSLYTRTPFYHSILHNSRADMVNKLLLKAAHTPSARDLATFTDRPKRRSFHPAAPLHLPPAKVGPHDFRGIYQLGKGSFGEVYLVEKLDTGEFFALKVLKKEKVFGSNLVRYAFTERNILMKITHPYIVKLHSSFQTPEKLVLVMEFCPNRDLGTLLAREKKLTESAARFYSSQVLLALQELHSHGIIFRDLKPENVVLDAEGNAKLTDFGLSKDGVIENTLQKSFCGSIAYLAPEILRRTGHTRSVDWYLLGALLYEMLVGSPPYYSSNREELFSNIQRGKLKIPHLMSQSARSLIQLLLNRDPAGRLGASKRDAEEIKEHEFFKGVDWDALARKEAKGPTVQPIKRISREITIERMFGKLNIVEEKQLEGWSFMQALGK